MNIFLFKNNQQLGPYSEKQIKEMIDEGYVHPDDLVWKDGMENWQRVDLVLTPTNNNLPPILKKPIYDSSKDIFLGSIPTMLNLARTAVEELGWEITSIESSQHLVIFETGISWGSWNGIRGKIRINQTNDGYKISGEAKQIVRGFQIASFDLFGEANKTIKKSINKMKEIASQ